jgi:hypothetical protein
MANRTHFGSSKRITGRRVSAGYDYGAKPLVLWPNHLNTYRNCPLRYFLQHVRKKKGKVIVQPAMTRGKVTHDVLADSFNHFRWRGTFPTNLPDRIARRLPEDDYDSRAHWRSEVEMIEDWVDRAVSTFDPASVIINVERVYDYPYPGSSRCGAFTLKSRVDLVLRQPNGTLEHIDWKTGGSRWNDRIQNVISRLGVGKAMPEAAVRTTNVFLALGESRSEQLTRDDVQPTWNEMLELINRISAGDDWEPQENALCAWCPYAGDECPIC